MGDVRLHDSHLTIDAIGSHTINAIESHTINAIEKIDNISPVAIHIKEVNQIDPVTVESLHVRGVKNVEPLQIEKLNITNVPAVNMSVRQAPPLDMNVRRVPPLSIGLHQHLDIPSDYLMRASLLGVELARVRIQGRSRVVPRERYRREVSRTMNRSFPEVAAGGNPAIPSRHIEKSVTFQCRPQWAHPASAQTAPSGAGAHSGLSVGQPVSFRLGPSAVRGG